MFWSRNTTISRGLAHHPFQLGLLPVLAADLLGGAAMALLPVMLLLLVLNSSGSHRLESEQLGTLGPLGLLPVLAADLLSRCCHGASPCDAAGVEQQWQS
ncbi:hypothetical protein GPALN_003221 [Globodera pallida]|nr:hypothetical protein GPALN_003221 [Globodera pallida]